MLIATEQLKDLGTVNFGQIQNFEFEIENTLEKDMVINKIQVSCTSCTTATMPKKVRGKEKVIMKVTYKPGAVGKTNKWIDIRYDGDQILRVNFKALVNG
jgi:hypothetical protein